MIVAITGKKRAGKDTAAQVFIDEFRFIKYSIAAPLKEAAKIIFDFDEEQVNGEKKDSIDERLGITPRKVLNAVGTELFQFDIYNHIPELEKKIPKRKIWIKKFEWWLNNHPHSDIVINDLRFPHEAREIKRLFGVIIKIKRPDFEREISHLSEKNIDKIEEDFTIINDATIEELKNKVLNLCYSKKIFRPIAIK